MMIFSAHIPTIFEEFVRKYVESLVSLLALLSPEILPDEGLTIHLWKNNTSIWFDMQFAVKIGYFFL